MNSVPIALIGCDGIGRELAQAVSRLLNSCFGVGFLEIQAGYEHFRRTGKTLGAEDLQRIGSCRGILFGATQSPPSTVAGYRSPILLLRKHFDLFANIRPIRTRLKGGRKMDVIIVRENLEGLYAGRERSNGPEEAVAEKVVTARNTERLARFAFEHAQHLGRTRVTVVHKSNVLKLSDGMFRRICLEVGRDYPDMEVREEFVDAAAYHLVRDAGRFDVILTTNMYGDILSDVAAGVSDGLGFAPSLSIGPETALAEPIHGSAPDIAGKGIANPYGMVFCSCLLLERLGQEQDSRALGAAAEQAIAEGFLTPDAGGSRSTEEVLCAVEQNVRAGSRQAE